MKSSIMGVGRGRIPIFLVFSKGRMILAQMTRKTKSIEHVVEIKEKIMLHFADPGTAEIQSSFGANN